MQAFMGAEIASWRVIGSINKNISEILWICIAAERLGAVDVKPVELVSATS